MMSRVSTRKTVGRAAALVFLLATTLGPWFADSHPATAATCSAPLVWLGDGYCACLVTFVAYVEYCMTSENGVWLLLLPVALPVLGTLLLFVIGERRWMRVIYLAAWGLAAISALQWFVLRWYLHRGVLNLWGAGLGGMVGVALLAGEILMARLPLSKDRREEAR